MALLTNGTPGEAYNVANMDTVISIKDMAVKFIELYPESKIKLIFDLKDDATKLGYNATTRNVLNSEKLMKIGWNPQFSLEDMIRHLVSSISEYSTS